MFQSSPASPVNSQREEGRALLSLDGPTRANPDFGPILFSVTIYYCNLNATATECKTQNPHRTTNRRRIANRATRGRAELPPVGSHNRARPTLDTNQHWRKSSTEASHPRHRRPNLSARYVDSNCRRPDCSLVSLEPKPSTTCAVFFLSSIRYRPN